IQENVERRWQSILAASEQFPLFSDYQDDIKQILALSPFVGELIATQPKVLAEILEQQWHIHADAASLCTLLAEQLENVESEPNLLAALRQFSQTHM
ncbi:hypothetical protein, partial [Opacimonas viscosa]